VPRAEDAGPNRRIHERVHLRSRCWCEADEITLYARILNVSEGGAFIRTFAPLRRGASARLRFVLDEPGSEVAAEAEVVWVRESAEDSRDSPGMGLRFIGLDEPSARALREYIGRSQGGGVAA
jgi:uncharacterized protein (TIGR02266 family)